MGFFDCFRKKGTPSIAAPTPTMREEHATCANDGTRFTFLVEDVFALRNKKGLVVVGNVHGTVRKGDAVYLLHPRTGVTLGQVSSLEVRHVSVSCATDQPVALLFETMQDKTALERFTVITSIRPQTVIDVNTAVENPCLLGLSMEYERFREDADFFKLLLHELARAKYLLAVHIEGEMRQNGDGTATVMKETTLRFPSVADSANTGAQHFPVFTDWEALARWSTVFDEMHPPKTMIMPLTDCAALAGKNSASVVVNPFGPVSMALPFDLVETLVAAHPQEAHTPPQESEKA